MNPDRTQSPFDTLSAIGSQHRLPPSVTSALTSATVPFPRPSLNGAHAPGAAAPGAPPPPTTGAAPAAAAGAVPITGFNPDEDPIVQLVKAAGVASVQQAQNAQLAGTKQDLIDFGYDPGLESLYPDASTAEAAKQNPFSFLANLKHSYDTGTHNLDESLNKSNLFYSGYRGTQLGEAARNYLGQQAAGEGSLGKALDALASAVLGAKTSASDKYTSAVGDAYGRYTPPETPAASGGAAAAAAARNPLPPAQALTQLVNPPSPPQPPPPTQPVTSPPPLGDVAVGGLAGLRRRTG